MFESNVPLRSGSQLVAFCDARHDAFKEDMHLKFHLTWEAHYFPSGSRLMALRLDLEFPRIALQLSVECANCGMMVAAFDWLRCFCGILLCCCLPQDSFTEAMASCPALLA